MIKIKFEKEINKAVAYDSNTKIGECAFIEEGKYWNIFHTEVVIYIKDKESQKD